MGDVLQPEPIEVSISMIAPARLRQKASREFCGLFFPYRANLPVGLAVDWEGETHLIHLEGQNAFQEGRVGIGSPIKGTVIRDFEYRVDATSSYNSAEQSDPSGALVLRNGMLYLCCRRLGDALNDDPYPVPVGGELLPGEPEEACGFTRWSIAVREGSELHIVRTFEAIPTEI
jgi:hypothetical protein